MAGEKIVQGDWEYLNVGSSWFKNRNIKKGKQYRGKTFHYYKCRYCGRLISTSGFASKHMKKHLRGG